MTIPKIQHLTGNKNSENIILTCTGCNEHYSYSVRKYKGDFGCNISEFEHFLGWAKWHAAQHECFLAGRVGYISEPPTAGSRGSELARHEDPWGGVGYIIEPEDDDPFDFDSDCPTCGKPSELFVDGDCPACCPPIEEGEDDLDSWMDEELDLPPYTPLDAAKTLDFRRLYEMEPSEWPTLDYIDDDEVYWPDEACMSHEECDMEPCIYAGEEDEEEDTFSQSLADAIDLVHSLTGRISVRHPTIQEISRVYSFDYGKYGKIEQRAIDQWLLDAGVYSLDEHGCLRDEKNRCLACLRPGPHLPFYWERDHR